MNIGKNIEKCKLCQKDNPLIQAHIIPKSLMQPISSVPYIFSKSDYPKKSPNGIYDDKTILCKVCDNRIGVLDDKMKEFFDNIHRMDEKKENIIEKNDFTLIWLNLSPEYCFNIKLGLLSILYRAHITLRPEFNEVDLGAKYLDILHRYLINFVNEDVVENIEVFDIFISKYLKNNLLMPIRDKQFLIS